VKFIFLPAYAGINYYQGEFMKKEYNVINLHLLENCNYNCKHCFAHFDSSAPLSVQNWKRIIDNITKKTSVSRFNLAGGEPLLYKGLDELIEYINSKKIQISLITNGHLLSKERIHRLKGKVSMIGMSIDALQPELLRKMGRCTQTKEILSPDKCVTLCKFIKKNNIQLKINTVVSRLNLQEDFSDFIKTVCPTRWKILKMKRFSNDNFNNTELDITENEFNRFCSTYSSLIPIKEASLRNSYIMIDARGKLVDNSGESYTVVVDLLREDFRAGFSVMHFDKTLYESRYKQTG
jgi:radical S-adenosyl methionine domain-containing protein 2